MFVTVGIKANLKQQQKKNKNSRLTLPTLYHLPPYFNQMLDDNDNDKFMVLLFDVKFVLRSSTERDLCCFGAPAITS